MDRDGSLFAIGVNRGEPMTRPAAGAPAPVTVLANQRSLNLIQCAVRFASRMEARLSDGGVLKLLLLDQQIRLKTPYGRLVIPVADITRIDCATRIPDEVSENIANRLALSA